MTTERALSIALSVLKAFPDSSLYADYQDDDRRTLNWSDGDYADMLKELEKLAGRWTAAPLVVSDPPDVETMVALEYPGHCPYGDAESDDSEAGTHVDREAFYGEHNGDFGGGLIGYFGNMDWLADVVTRLNYFTPGWSEGWRWQVFDFLNKEDHQEDFSASLRGGVTGIYDPDGELRGYMLGGVESPPVYVLLAVLNQGPVPRAQPAAAPTEAT